ncbi:MAG: class IV adenylate cyclase [Planctomycetota bacterium]|jgi:adenylate cyclase class 2
MLEVEIKLPVDAGALLKKLEKRGAEFLKREQHLDIYFQHPGRDFSRTDEALRIRRAGHESILGYKGPKLGNAGKIRQELETRLEDPAGLSKILESIGFRHAGEVRELRETWRLNEVSLFIDQVEGLGDFVEIEKKVEEDREHAEVLASLFELAQSWGLNPKDEIRKSYLELILESSQSKDNS